MRVTFLLSALLAVAASRAPARAEPIDYVPIASSFEVQLVDTRDGGTIGHIPVANGPIGVAVDAAHARVYVAHQGGNALTVIDTTTRSVIAQLPLPTDAWGVALSPDGSRAYVALSGQDKLGVVDTAGPTLLTAIDVGDTPRDVVLSPDGTRVYVSNQNGASISVIDATDNSLVGTFALAQSPLGLAIRPGGAIVYAVSYFDGTLVRFDTTTNSVVGTTPVEAGPSGVAVSADGSRIYTTNTADDSVSVVDGASHAVITRIPVGDGPYGISLGADGAHAYVVNVYGHSVSAIDTQTNTVDATWPLVGGAFAVGSGLAPATVPDAPTLTGATPADGAASVAFAAAFDGGSAIVGYAATCAPGGHGGGAVGSPIAVTGLTNGQVYHCTVHAANAIGIGPESVAASVIPGADGNSTDLAIAKTNAADFVGGAQRIAYRIMVTNAGPAAAAGARVTDTLESYFSQAQWQCSASGGAECAASGTGDLDLAVDLPAGSAVQIDLSAVLAPLPEDPVMNVAAVAVPASMLDPDPDNNVASDGPDQRGVFRDGFE